MMESKDSLKPSRKTLTETITTNDEIWEKNYSVVLGIGDSKVRKCSFNISTETSPEQRTLYSGVPGACSEEV